MGYARMSCRTSTGTTLPLSCTNCCKPAQPTGRSFRRAHQRHSPSSSRRKYARRSFWAATTQPSSGELNCNARPARLKRAKLDWQRKRWRSRRLKLQQSESVSSERKKSEAGLAAQKVAQQKAEAAAKRKREQQEKTEKEEKERKKEREIAERRASEA